MINIYDRVFGTIYEAVKEVSPDADILNASSAIPSRFPCVTVRELNKTTTVAPIGTRNKAKYARISYQIDAYSNANDGKRADCETIVDAISDALILRNFELVSSMPTPNERNADIYRITARYEVIADDKNNTYRRI